MEDRPRFQTGPREIRPSGIIGGPRETWPGWNCAPTSHTERARMVTLHLYTGAPELYPNNPTPRPLLTFILAESRHTRRIFKSTANRLGEEEFPAGPRRYSENRPRRSEEHTSELQSRVDLVCRLLLEKKK